jgi:hypothetical protein
LFLFLSHGISPMHGGLSCYATPPR